MENRVDVDKLALPAFVMKDVTGDPFFTGGNLATLTEEDFRKGLLQRLHDPTDLSSTSK
jgi:hypothetical protein